MTQDIRAALFTASEQKGIPGHCWVAQVFDPDGKAYANIDSTLKPEVASERARKIAAALNALASPAPEAGPVAQGWRTDSAYVADLKRYAIFDDEGLLKPQEPFSWETLARVAVDLAVAALAAPPGASVPAQEPLTDEPMWDRFDAMAPPQAAPAEPQQPVARIDPLQDPMRPVDFLGAGPADEHPAELVLRKLACWLGVGGFNAPTVDAELFHRKIVDGINSLAKEKSP